MKELNIDELRSVEVDILDYIDSVCRENNIQYSLSGGSLLGAIRHKGFIPWDDDIDIFMTRDNYEKFIRIMNNASCGYKLITYRNTANYNYLHSKVVALKTSLIDFYDKKIQDMGVFVDIFPVDNLGESQEAAIEAIKKIRLKKYLGVATNWKRFYLKKFKSPKRQVIRFFFYVLSKFYDPQKSYKQVETYLSSIDENNYMGIACGVYEFKEIMPREVFSSYIEVDFEGKKYMGIKNYDTYLHHLYGNYMELPPENQRETHHGFNAYLR